MARILILSPYFPLPLQSGGQVRVFHVVRHLARCGHQVTFLSFLLPHQRGHVDALKKVCHRVETVSGRMETSLLGKFQGRWRPLEVQRLGVRFLQSMKGVPVLFSRFYHPEMVRCLRQVIAEEGIEFVQVEYSQMAPYLLDPAVKRSGAKTILVAIDLSFVVADRTSAHTKPWIRPLFRLESFLERRYGRKVLPGVFRVVAMSEEDAAVVKEVSPGASVVVAPNGVDVDFYRFHKRKADGGGLLFVGGSGHPPNRDAMVFFGQQILPRLQAEIPDTHLTVIGTFERKDGAFPPGLRFQGFQEDLRPWMADHAVFVVPLRIGSGTRLKILEAFGSGIPVVSTRVGAEGLRVSPGEDILIADSAEDFSRAVIRLLRDPAYAQRMADKARERVVRTYGWDRTLAPLEAVYRTESVGA